jgi:hypothetical protein
MKMKTKNLRRKKKTRKRKRKNNIKLDKRKNLKLLRISMTRQKFIELEKLLYSA